MAFSSIFGFNGLGAPTRINLTTANSQYFSGAVLTDAGNTAVFYYDNTSGGGILLGRLVGPDGAGTGAEVTVATGVLSSTDYTDGVASVARLNNGNLVVTWADNGATAAMHYRIYDQNLNPLTVVLDGPPPAGGYIHPDVAALTDGGFVIVWERVFSATDHDIHAQRYNADGTANGSIVYVENSSATFDELPSVAGLVDGGFAVAFDRRDGVTGDTAAWHGVYNADGTTRLTPVAFDTVGSFNSQMDVLGLPNGGYMVTYADNGWTAQDITSWRFTATGGSQGFLHTGSLGGSEDFPASALSPDGFVFVQHESVSSYNQYGALIAPDGALLTSNQVLVSSAADEYWGSPVWLDRSHILATWSVNSPGVGNDGSNGAIVVQEFEVIRTTTGDGAGDTINFTSDGLIDRVFAGAGADIISTGDGSDVIDGQAGADFMRGGDGNDLYYVDDPGDAIVEDTANTAIGGVDRVISSITYTLPVNVENLTMVGTGNIIGNGNGSNNFMSGNAQANTLRAWGGNDVFTPGGGNDWMSGGIGQDYFVFNTALGPNNRDGITDFNHADDTIRLDDAIFLTVGPVGQLAATAFWAGTAAHDPSDRIIYNSATGQIFYDADGVGGGAGILFATLTNRPTNIDHTDFVII